MALVERAEAFGADVFEADVPDLAVVLDLVETAVALRDAAGRVAEAFRRDAALFGATDLVGETVRDELVFDFDVADAEALDELAFDPGVLDLGSLETLALAEETLAWVALDAAALAEAVLGGIWAHSLADPLWRRAGSARQRFASV